MPVRDAENVLRRHLRDRLVRLVGDSDITATFTLTAVQHLCETEDAFEVYQMWRLTLHLSRPASEDGKQMVMQLGGHLPFEACMDGDTRPLDLILDRMWEDQQFGWLMADDDLESKLEQVASESEG